MMAGVDDATPVTATFYWVAIAIFAITLGLVVSERIHKTKAVLLGASLMMVLPILTQHDALHSVRYGIDYNVVFLLISMMILVGIIGRSGVFEWAAIRSAKLARGRPLRIMVAFACLTAIASAFLDNVTTVLLVAPVTLLIADELDIDPVPFLITEALASNIGGTATLIGDPPNIMIASRARLEFVDFLVHLAPAVVVMMIGMLLGVHLLFGKRLRVDESKRQRIMTMDARRLIKDRTLAVKSMLVLGATLVGFMLHGVLHLEPATVALLGASVLLVISRGDPHKVFAGVEWSTIFFFIGLFIVVGGLIKAGVIRDVSQKVVEWTEPSRDTMYRTSMTVLWCSGLLSALVDNIPYVATMSPLILDMANGVFHGGAADAAELPLSTLHHAALMPVWWALALGSCLGGNATPIGASANVVVIGIAARSGVAVTFLRFVAYGVPTTLFTLVVSHVYLWLRYY